MQYHVTIFFNETRGLRFERFEPEAELVRGHMDGFHQKGVAFEADSPEEASNQAYAFFNADNRPNGMRERSLSVGDVVRVSASVAPFQSEITYLACEPLGWRRIERTDLKRIRNKANPNACCELGEEFACFCMHAHSCPTHGEVHVGTHD